MKLLLTAIFILCLTACTPTIPNSNSNELEQPADSSSGSQVNIEHEASDLSTSNASAPSADAFPEEIDNSDYYDDRLSAVVTQERPPLPKPENSGDFDFTAIHYSLLPEELWEQYTREEIVEYYKLIFKPSPNIHLWQRWQKNFAEGEPDRVLLYLNAEGLRGCFYELIADGSPTYTINAYNGNTTKEYHSSEILHNEFFVCFAPEVQELAGNDWVYSNTVLYTKPRNIAVIPYVIGSDVSLGDVSPDKAIDLALAALEDISAQYDRGAAEATQSKNESGEPRPHSPGMRIRIIGALSIYGHPCYVIKTSSPKYDEAWDRTVAVNADGGNLVFEADQMGGDWFLRSDSNMQSIKRPAQ